MNTQEEKSNSQTSPNDIHAKKMSRLINGMALRSKSKEEFKQKLSEKGLSVENYKGTLGIKTWRFISLKNLGLEPSLKKWEQEKDPGKQQDQEMER
ncbi:MAG: hypothetical protein HKN39_02490 [Flavobacteriales bacterium]|nr:hypothetical protein [Flavobacteriales bacterium]